MRLCESIFLLPFPQPFPPFLICFDFFFGNCGGGDNVVDERETILANIIILGRFSESDDVIYKI